MLNTALTIILDEHRSMAAITHGLRFLVHEMREKGSEPDSRLLWSMLYYVHTFPQKLHHPKEEAYLFRLLKLRTREADKTILQLEEQHHTGIEHIKWLETALGRYQAAAPGGREDFMAAAENFANEIAIHMALEENVLLPLAKQHLQPQDWAEIAKAFGENGDPRFGAEQDHEFRTLFSRIVNLAPPPIGVGRSRPANP
ncbi:MAG: hemerythrin domain-containing protein [Zoogloeaceae bacterium]|jgi:hemerythrin-like domain-containing protein|nr:hemerythrin domain-containing protein [Zoogloeaceae bacterium]